ncbi:protein kinase domain containing protein [Stylonychia lemnae]|uniref:Protein kinase domain containing protein n=1 Tax=Stylonychia lemnae TaxID=5949 RepID=A0A078B085_STYLE|nr:protein kinase domain containing protein [Stylonychia lemnae]|eukprot:CDW88075.1 protein kinase domain containing protein [Stylonychia lemnae]
MHKTLKVDTSKQEEQSNENQELFLGFNLGKGNNGLIRMCLSPSLTVSQMSSDLVPKKSPLDKNKLIKMSTVNVISEQGTDPLTAKANHNIQKANTFLDAYSYTRHHKAMSTKKSNNHLSQNDSDNSHKKQTQLSQCSKVSSVASSGSKRDSFRNKLKGNLDQILLKQYQAKFLLFKRALESQLARNSRSPFHQAYDEGEFIGEVIYILNIVIQGLSATVSKCTEKKSGELMAVKVMRTDDEEKLMAAQNEYTIQKQLKHPTLIIVKELFFENLRNTIYTVMEYVDGKDLQNYITQHGPFKEKQAKFIAKQLLKCAKYLHNEAAVCHRDIKPDNIILINNNDKSLQDYFQIKLCDFNVAKKINKDKIMMTKTGLEEWSAPEMRGGSKYDEKVDMWSIGCVIFYMFTGYPPFNPKRIASFHQSIQTGKIQYINQEVEQIKTFNSIPFDLISKLIQPDPTQRLNASQALNHVWFKKPKPKSKGRKNDSLSKYSASNMKSDLKPSMQRLEVEQFYIGNHESPQPSIKGLMHQRGKPKQRYEEGEKFSISLIPNNNNLHNLTIQKLHSQMSNNTSNLLNRIDPQHYNPHDISPNIKERLKQFKSFQINKEQAQALISQQDNTEANKSEGQKMTKMQKTEKESQDFESEATLNGMLFC